ncbi:MAG: hypothetical protein WCQ70_11380, partial [Lentimicrobiaceae bacterium]
MKNLFVLLLSVLFIMSGISNVHGQMYILNEDFSTASGNTPPAGWNSYSANGQTSDVWQFNNPGGRVINFPVLPPFAMFDSEFTSVNGNPEEVVLESPAFDASISNFIILKLDQTFFQGTGGSGRIEAFDGSEWSLITEISSSTSNPLSDIIDISSVVGGVTNAKVRFTWFGNGSGYWALDNVAIFAPLPIDAGLPELDNPTLPFNTGVKDIKVTLGNYGYQTLTTTRIKWSVNGVQQPDYIWNGNLSIGTRQENITIGTYNFTPEPADFKIWQEQPNGQQDLNPDNDSIVKTLQAALCGEYTIGGTSPDFATFTQAVSVLKTVGISCPVVFNVRDGAYCENFMLNDISGSSESNTITFQSESGDSTAAVINSPLGVSIITLRNVNNIKFSKLGFNSNQWNDIFTLSQHCHDISIEHCFFAEAYSKAVNVFGTSTDTIRSINVINNNITTIN